MAELSPLKLVRAREGSYRLLGQLFLNGPTPDLSPYLAAISDGPLDTDQEAGQLEEVQASFQHIFRFSLFPHQSLFLDTSGLVGGAESDAVRHVYTTNGFGINSDADHLGWELQYLAFLCAAEADAWEDDLPHVAQQIQQRQHTFLIQHLLRWLPPLCAALGQQGDPLYAALAETLWQLVAEHVTGGAPAPQLPPPPPLPTPPDLLADDKTGLRDIATFLITPAYAGLWLGREEIGTLARALDLPRGFGGRQQLLTNLLRTAAQFEQFSALLTTLQTLLVQRATALASCAAAYPLTAPYVSLWQERLTATQHLLAKMQTSTEFEA